MALAEEVLRGFVTEHGRPPQQAEQSQILADQVAAETKARKQLSDADSGILIVDPSVLMTAVYSILYFDDDSLVERAVEHCRTYDLHGWCIGDFSWHEEPGMRDGLEYRVRAERIIGQLVADFQLPVVKLTGSVQDRVEAILAA